MAMGLNNSFMSLGRMAGPAWAGFVFVIQMGYPYLSGALIMLSGFLLSLGWLKEEPHVKEQVVSATDPRSTRV